MLRDVPLSSPLHLVPGKWFEGSLHEVRATTSAMPSGLEQIIHDLRVRPDGVPAVLHQQRDRAVLQLHTYNYVVHLTVSNKQDFCWVNRVRPLGLHAHTALAAGCLLVRCDWRAVDGTRDVPKESSASWEKLRKEWRRLEEALAEENSVPRLSTEHERFLDEIVEYNAIASAVEEGSTKQDDFIYHEVTAVGDHDSAGTSTYSFRFVDRPPQARSEVSVGGRDPRRGTVLRVAGRTATIRFDTPLDHALLPPTGRLSPARFSTVHHQRRNAVELLRTRRSHHRSLLAVLVDHQVGPMTGRPDHPDERLDPEQLLAFRRALSVRDLMVVLGPPGTGKTRVITEIAAAAAADERGKTLVSSHSNKAVDNVLARLPRDRMVLIRIGREAQVDPEVRPFLLEVYAEELRKELAVGAGRRAQLYSVLPDAVRMHAELGERLESWASARGERRACADELERCRRAVGGPVYARARKEGRRLTRAERRVDRTRRRVDRLESAAGGSAGLLGRWRARRLARSRSVLVAREHVLDEVRATHSATITELDEVVCNEPEVQAAQREVVDAEAEAGRRCGDVRAAVATLRTMLLAVENLPEIPDPGNDEALARELTELHRSLVPRLNALHARAALLADWHTEVGSCRAGALHPELLRYADVIGATCISAGSREEVAAEEFDLVVLDEAGQIRTSDALIPLGRGRRAVLVGDDRQLPPVAEPEVDAEIERQGAEKHLVTLAGTSLLETLVGILPEPNVVQLRTQRRMPAMIARFISDHFYSGTLRSEVPPPQRIHPFRSPLAFVDTSSLPERVRRQTRADDHEHGCRNAAEARLLDRLAAHYHRDGADWAMIVPYRAQLEDLKQLAREWANPQTVDANIGTVDAFQGGERDVVLYGFTRSNRFYDVGFLAELRRLNVAFTRAKCLLVLVGDLEFLRQADDPGVLQLIRELDRTVREAGDLRNYHEICTALDEIGA